MFYERARLRTWIALAAVFSAAITVCCAPLMAAQPPAAPSEHCAPGEAAPAGPNGTEPPLSQCCLLLAAEMKHSVQVVPAPVQALNVAAPLHLGTIETGLVASASDLIVLSPLARERLTQHICVLLI